eukprot:11195067-Lingulodinium_polyedra.AAC.1
MLRSAPARRPPSGDRPWSSWRGCPASACSPTHQLPCRHQFGRRLTVCLAPPVVHVAMAKHLT